MKTWITFHDLEKNRVMIHKGTCRHIGSSNWKRETHDDDTRYRTWVKPNLAVIYANSLKVREGALVCVCKTCRPQVLRFILGTVK